MPPVRRGAVDLTPSTTVRKQPTRRHDLLPPTRPTGGAIVGRNLAELTRAEDDYRTQVADLHPEQRPPIVRLKLTDRVIDPAGWLEVRPYLVAWCQAGAAWLELDGGRFVPSAIAGVGDVRDLYGVTLVIVDHEIARDALSVLRPAKAAGAL